MVYFKGNYNFPRIQRGSNIKNLQMCEKMMCNIPNLYHVSMNTPTKCSKILSIYSQGNKRKQNYDGIGMIDSPNRV